MKIPFYYHFVIFSGIWLLYELGDLSMQTNLGAGLFEDQGMFSWSYQLTLFLMYLLHYYGPCRWFLGSARLLWFVLTLPLSMLCFVLLRYGIDEVIIYKLSGQHNYYDEARQWRHYLSDNAGRGLSSIFQSTIVFALWTNFQKQKTLNALENARQEAELKVMRNQIAPHFLFNTLNLWYSKWQEKQPEIAENVLQLSEMLRYSLEQSRSDRAQLKDELHFLENYIQLHHSRFEGRLFLSFQIQGIVANQAIIPAVLIHFLENIFKHGLLDDPEKPAIFQIQISSDTLRLHSSNHLDPAEHYGYSGIGFENLQKRLNLLFPGQYTLTRTLENRIFSTTLKMPLYAT